MKTKKLALLTCIVLVLIVGVGATLAWLTDQTQTVTNTFTASDINIELTETDADEDGKADENDYQMVPGSTIAKDPVVTVKAGSEDCWVFVKVNKNESADEYLEYSVDENNWIHLTTENGEEIYYCKATSVTEDRKIKVLLNNEVKVKDTVTKEMMEEIINGQTAEPDLIFTAYAVQLENIADVEDAWKAAKGLSIN